jgi:hypothetical protein
MRCVTLTLILLAGWTALEHGKLPAGDIDPRNIQAGFPIPVEGYCDQPYIVITRSGQWLCTLTTGPGKEGQFGQHVVATTSRDHGRTWSPLVDIEPSSGPEASWVVPLVVPSGRIYAFYTYNGDRVSTLGGKKIRADMLGWYAYKCSDDEGRTWSQRYRLPMRITACDRGNNWQGQVIIFWGICKPLRVASDVYFSFTKLGRYMLDDGEGWLYRSDNILGQSDVANIHWDMLPQGDHGIRAPAFGSVQEEHNMVSLSGKGLYCVYRTTTGYPCHSYSTDGGRTWTTPEHMTYSPSGRRIKNPRACPKVWQTSNGKYLFWFHNHSGKSYPGRNPAWICGGLERDGKIYWSQPEIVLYDSDPQTRMSYPDLVEQDGRSWITETQKTIARVHQLDPTLLEGLWSQGQAKLATRGLLAEGRDGPRSSAALRLPKPLDLRQTGGVSIDLWIRLDDLAGGQIVLDGRDEQGRGIALATTSSGTLRLELNDGQTKTAWDTDPGLLRPGKPHHLVAIVDAGPKLVVFVLDGALCDGGEHRQFGWGRYEAELGEIAGSGRMRLAAGLRGQIKQLRLYDRPLRTSEAIGNFHHDRAVGEVLQ